MIKNNNQLIRAQSRLSSLQNQLNETEEGISGIELDLLAGPIQDEIEHLVDEINEYESLSNLSLEEAVRTILSKPMLIDNIGELLSKLRIAAGLSQEVLANKLGWHQSNISRFENPNYSSHSVSKIVEYASALNVWLHVSPSISEYPSSEANTEVDIKLEHILFSVGSLGYEIPTFRMASSDTITTDAGQELAEMFMGTDLILLEKDSEEYESVEKEYIRYEY